MAIDNNHDGVDDVTKQKINPDGTTSKATTPGSRRGAGSSNSPGSTTQSTPGGSKLTVVAPKPNEYTLGSAWAPKVNRIDPSDYIYSSGALSEEVALIQNPWSSAYNTWQTKSQLEGAWVRLTPQEQGLFNGIAAGRGHGSTGPGVFTDMIAESAANGTSQKSPVQIALEGVQAGRLPFAATGSGSGRSSGSGGSSGYNSQVNNYSESDIRSLADKLSLSMVGRGITDDEFKKALSQVRKAEAANPAVTTRTTSNPGLTQSGREDIIQNIIAKNPEYGDYQQATTMMDWFDKALQERMQSNG